MPEFAFARSYQGPTIVLISMMAEVRGGERERGEKMNKGDEESIPLKN